MSHYLVANRHKTTEEEEEQRGLRPRCAGLVLWVERSDVITSDRRLTSGEAASGFLDGHCSKRGCNKQQVNNTCEAVERVGVFMRHRTARQLGLRRCGGAGSAQRKSQREPGGRVSLLKLAHK